MLAVSKFEIGGMSRTSLGPGERVLKRGATLFRQGARGRYIFKVIEGGIKLSRMGSSGRELVLRLAGPGSLVAESMAFADESIYPATAIAYEPSVVEAIPAEEHRGQILSSPDLARAALARMTARTFEFLDHLALIRLENARFRVCTWLVAEAGTLGPGTSEVKLPGPKADIGSLLGLTPESFSRALADLREEGLIEVGRRRITLHDPKRLLELPRY